MRAQHENQRRQSNPKHKQGGHTSEKWDNKCAGQRDGGGTSGGRPEPGGERSLSKGGDEFQGAEGGMLLPRWLQQRTGGETGVHWREGPRPLCNARAPGWGAKAALWRMPQAHAGGQAAGSRHKGAQLHGSAAELRRTVGGCSRRLTWLLTWLRASVAHALLQILQLIVNCLADWPAGRQLQGGRTQKAGSVSLQREELATTHACR